MHTVTSFHASAVQPDRVTGIMADYLALQRARIIRHLLVKRCGLLAVIIAGVSVSWLPAFALSCSVGLCLVAPVWAWIVELGYERRLTRRLDEVQGQATQAVARKS